MKHVTIEKIGEHVGETVTVKGWLHNRRSSGKIHFLVVRDGTGFLQVVMGKNDVPEETFKAADHLSQETSIIVTGTVREDKRAKGGYELTGTGLEVVGPAQDYPITPKEHGVDYLMDRRHLWIRSRTADRHSPRPPRGDQRGARLLQQQRIHPGRHADLHAGRLRGHVHAVSGPVLRRCDGVSHAERSALQRSERDGARQGVLLRARPSAPRRARRAATSPSSGWWSPRWRTPISTTSSRWRKDSSRPSSGACSTSAGTS